jgi:hypothetical protein
VAPGECAAGIAQIRAKVAHGTKICQTHDSIRLPPPTSLDVSLDDRSSHFDLRRRLTLDKLRVTLSGVDAEWVSCRAAAPLRGIDSNELWNEGSPSRAVGGRTVQACTAALP